MMSPPRFGHPTLIGCRGREIAIQQVRRDGIGVIAVGRLFEPLRDFPLDLLLAHQPSDTFFADRLTVLFEVLPQPRTPIALAARFVERAELGPQDQVPLRPR
jgi:hypothetical protein